MSWNNTEQKLKYFGSGCVNLMVATITLVRVSWIRYVGWPTVNVKFEFFESKSNG